MQVYKVPVIAFYKLMEDLSLNLILSSRWICEHECSSQYAHIFGNDPSIVVIKHMWQGSVTL